MATIRPRKTKAGKRFQAIVRKKGIEQSKVFQRRADAVAWASIVESEVERGEFVDRSEADRTSFHDAIQKYAETVTPRKDGAKQELVRIGYWKRHRLSKTPISKLTPKHFSEWRDSELETKSPYTVNLHLSLISHFFNHARKEWGLPVKNPIEALWRPTKPKGRKRRLVGTEEFDLLREAKSLNPIFHDLIKFVIETGVRRGEVAKMRREHIKGNYFTLIDTKNGENRDVPMSQVAMNILNGIPKCFDGRVWPFSEDRISRLFQEAANNAEIKDLRFHDLRHEATTRLAKIYPIHELARITGHKTLTMLMGYYHPTADELAERLAHG